MNNILHNIDNNDNKIQKDEIYDQSHRRSDLTMAHLVARSGIKKTFHHTELTTQNKNDWLPIHLSKNKNIAEFLMQQTKSLIPTENIIIPAIKNNAQSFQTQYGVDLENFLIQQGFSKTEAKQASIEPTPHERIELSLYLLNQLDTDLIIKFDFNPLELALSHCNCFFFFALKESINKTIVIEQFKDSIILDIGTHFFIPERAFQVKQQLKLFFGINCEITHNLPTNYQPKTSDHLKNLEGS